MVVIHDDETRAFEMDDATGGLIAVDYPHHEIHGGSHYYIEGYSTLGNGASLRIKLVTPDTTKWAHFLWTISSNNILTAHIYEGSSGGMTGGTNVAPLNNNRNSTNTSGMVITSGVTAPTNLGTLISQASWAARNVGGEQTREDEIILKQNTTYYRIFTSGANDNVVNFKASWYEHTHKY